MSKLSKYARDPEKHGPAAARGVGGLASLATQLGARAPH